MPAFELTSPDGKKYRVEGPEGATQEQAYGILQKQLAAESGNTRGGDLARGLLHGATMGLAGDAPPEGSSGWRQTGETIGNLGTSAAAGFIPAGMAVKGLVGTGVGAMQPAGSMTERLENAAIGGGSALTGGLIGKMPKGAKTALDRLAEMGIGFSAGRHLGLGEWGPFAGLYAGRMIGREAEIKDEPGAQPVRRQQVGRQGRRPVVRRDPEHRRGAGAGGVGVVDQDVDLAELAAEPVH